jgi:D-alanyl-D-alanine carboxypeptidase/D-alanyl-D-alanine-endopeptidase (penicillin-binding protein 4)
MQRIKRLLTLSLLFITGYCPAQSLQQKLNKAIEQLQLDSQCQYASISLTVIDVNSGREVFSANPNLGLATASTLKTITTITALNVLGKDFKYQTQVGYSGSITNGVLNGDIIIKGAGDPTLGSPRYESSREEHVLSLMVDAIRKAGIKKINGRIIGDDSLFGTQSIPDGWIWEDVGNYYGAGTSGLCWRENEYNIKLHTGAIGTPVGIGQVIPAMPYLKFKSEATNAPAGTGDNTYAYLPTNSDEVYIRGTYATDQTKKYISAALPDPAFDAAFRLNDTLNRLEIVVTGKPESTSTLTEKGQSLPIATQGLTTISSPELSKIIYWTNQKSINLYAEQLLKTIAWKSGKLPSTANGVTALQDFWKQKGIDPNSLNIFDGSGLSPADRVTTRALATILTSAVNQPWYHDFYESLPIYNNIHMKSGSIINVLNYAGYQTHNGQQLCFSIMVNNYNGSGKAIKEKIFKVLDELK